jgi:hypothetical protein
MKERSPISVTVIRFFRDLSKRLFSNEAHLRLVYYWRYWRFQLNRRKVLTQVRQTPLVCGQPSELANQLKKINVSVPTALCRFMTKHGSDKGSAWGGGWHNYTTVYYELFGKLRRHPLRIFELGIGSNNPDLPFNMGVEGRPGASLRGWREFFPNALLFGADIDHNALFNENRIQTFHCDQLSASSIRELWAQPLMQGGMDIIVEDGLHTFEANSIFLAESLQQLRANGFYIIEDIHKNDVDKWRNHLAGYAAQFPNHDFVLVQLPNPANTVDNNLLIIRKRS